MSNKNPLVVGFVGFISSGKDTAADYLVNYHQFRRDSFANSLKDAAAAVFGWDRVLLEGRSAESREWREQVDAWWAERLNMPNLTPRWILQNWGTEVCRHGFHDDIWIASLEHRILKTRDNIVITDVRFPNEIKAIRNAGGRVVRIKRGPDPEWYQDAVNVNAGPSNMKWATSKWKMERLGIHASETAWVGLETDAEISNDGTIDQLFAQLANLIKNQESGLPVSTAV